ncbi:MAG TPA: UxaA family hydrolase [Syntrophomonadaceae bacterium]|nr:UxaA family hydrolase [Syntrophomonadaceae bacterium]
MAQVLRINDIDNVVIAAEEIKLGTIIIDQGRQIKVLDDIPIGHKIATSKIKKGENVNRYGNPIGHAVEDIEIGAWAHVHNIRTNLKDIVDYEYNRMDELVDVAAENIPTFKGYRRKDGKTGIRNEIWVIPTVFCANGPAQKIVEEANRLYGKTVLLRR